MFSMAGVNKARFLEQVRADPQTYRDWAGNGEWDIETTGKEDDMFSPFLRKPFKRAVEAGVIPASLNTIAGTWGSVSDQGDLTYLNLIHLPGVDGTDANDLTAAEIEGRRQAIHAIEALRGFMPGCEQAKLRNFGMTLGVRDTRKIDAALQPDRGGRARAGPLRRMRSASFRSSSTATGCSSCRPRDVISTFPIGRWFPRASATCSSPAARSAATGSRMPRCAT